MRRALLTAAKSKTLQTRTFDGFNSGTWQVPAGVSLLESIEVWGCGGRGGAGTNSGGGGGGGGGGYAKAINVAVTSGESLMVLIDIGQATYVRRGSSTYLARATSGSNGVDGSFFKSGGGGSGGTGVDGSVLTAGSNGGGGSSSSGGRGGDGGNGGSGGGGASGSGATGASGTAPGGGGGGSRGSGRSSGAYGRIKITYLN